MKLPAATAATGPQHADNIIKWAGVGLAWQGLRLTRKAIRRGNGGGSGGVEARTRASVTHAPAGVGMGNVNAAGTDVVAHVTVREAGVVKGKGEAGVLKMAGEGTAVSNGTAAAGGQTWRMGRGGAGQGWLQGSSVSNGAGTGGGGGGPGGAGGGHGHGHGLGVAATNSAIAAAVNAAPSEGSGRGAIRGQALDRR